MLVKLKLLALSILSIFSPIKPILLTALTLVLIDLIIGVVAAKKRGESITSSGFQRTIIKLFVYMSAIILGFLTETYLTGDTVAVCKIISSFVGLTEFTSILESLNEISGGSLLKSIISKLGSKNEENK